MAAAGTTFKDRGDGVCERCGRVIGWHAGTSCYTADATGMPAPDLTTSDVSPTVPGTLEGTQHLEHVARAAQAATRAREELDAAIVAARRDGVALRRIADAAGLSHEHVRRLTSERGEA